MDYFSEAVDVFKQDDKMLKKTLIGGLVMMLSILVIPLFFVQGYFMKIIKETRSTPLETYPEWNNWGELFVMGFVAMVINLALTIPTQILIYIPEVMRLQGVEASSAAYALMGVGYLLSFVVGYITPVLYAMYFREEGTITDFERMKQIALSKDYLIAYFIIIAIAIGAGIGIFLLVIFTIGIGLLAVPFLYFPIQCITMYILGSAITDADPQATKELEPDEPTQDFADDDYSVEYAN